MELDEEYYSEGEESPSEMSEGEVEELLEQAVDAIQSNDQDTFLSLLDEIPDDAINDEIHGKRLLHYTAEYGNAYMTQKLLEYGADQTIPSEDGDILDDALALHYASYAGSAKCVEVLLADAQEEGNLNEIIFATDHADFTPLLEALVKRNEEVIEVFLKYGVDNSFYEVLDDDSHDDTFCLEDIPTGANMLHLAAIYGSKALTQHLIQTTDLYNKRAAETNWYPKYREPEELLFNDRALVKHCPKLGTPLHSAAYKGDANILKLFLDCRDCRINALDGYRRSPLFYLVLAGDVVLTSLYLKRKPKLNVIDIYGYSIFYYAVINNKFELLKCLLDHGMADEHFMLRNVLNNQYEEGKSLLQIAYVEKFDEVLSMLIRCTLISVNQKDHHDKELIHYAVLDGRSDVIELLQGRGVDYSARVENSGQKRQLKNLEQQMGLNPNYMNANQALHYLVGQSEAECLVEFEREFGEVVSDESEEGDTPLHTGVKKATMNTVSTLFSDPRANIRSRDTSGKTVINTAKYKGGQDKYDTIRALQYAHLNESSSGSDSSDESEEETAPSLKSRKQASPLQNQKSIQLNLDLINDHLRRGSSPDIKLMKNYVVVHYRGVNFHRKHFPHKHLRDFLKLQHVGRSLHSKMTHQHVDIPFSKLELTSEDLLSLNTFDRKIKYVWKELFDQNFEMKQWWGNEGNVFRRPSFAMQQYYTNQASKTNEVGIAVDIWIEIWAEIQKHLPSLLQNKPHLSDLIKEIEFEGSLFISTGKTPEHSVNYAVGGSLSQENRSQRADPRYRQDGKPKYKHIGMVYTIMHPLNDFLNEVVSDTVQLRHRKEISIRNNYAWETEVAFIGGIDGRFIVDAMKIKFPDFSRDYDQGYHLNQYGLDKNRYAHFKEGFKNAQRPFVLRLDILKSDYQTRYDECFSLSKDEFNAYRDIYVQLKKEGPIHKELIDRFVGFAKPLQIKRFKALHLKGTDIKEALLVLLQKQIESKVRGLFKNDYQDKYLKIFGLNQHEFNAFKNLFALRADQPLTLERLETNKCAFSAGKYKSYKEMLSKEKPVEKTKLLARLDKELRDKSPYRRLKMELRAHFSSVFDASSDGFYAKKLLKEAQEKAAQQGKVIVYQGSDGLFRLFDKPSKEVRSLLVKGESSSRNQHSAFLNNNGKRVAEEPPEETPGNKFQKTD